MKNPQHNSSLFPPAPADTSLPIPPRRDPAPPAAAAALTDARNRTRSPPAAAPLPPVNLNHHRHAAGIMSNVVAKGMNGRTKTVERATETAMLLCELAAPDAVVEALLKGTANKVGVYYGCITGVLGMK